MSPPPDCAAGADRRRRASTCSPASPPLIERVLASVTEVGRGDDRAGLGGQALAGGRCAAPTWPRSARWWRRCWRATAGSRPAPGSCWRRTRWRTRHAAIDWWWADQGIGQLEVDLDPGSAEFYDYTTTEWYREPARTGRPCIAGPYVDYICTHEYTFTVSVPVVDQGRFVGVAGADILAGEVERMLLPGLSLLGRASRPAVLVSGNGRVIASGTARILPGKVLRPAGPGRPARPAGRTALAGRAHDGRRPAAVDAARRAGRAGRGGWGGRPAG